MISAGHIPDFDTVILAGGRASRLGGADKPGMVVGGTPMLVSVAHAAAVAGTGRLIVVGPARPGIVEDGLAALAAGRTGWLTWVEEVPAGSGPVAGLRRGLAEAGAPWLLMLAADLPFLTEAHLAALLAAGRLGAGRPTGNQDDLEAVGGSSDDAIEVGMSGIVSIDLSGRPQWLTSCWRTGALRSVLAVYTGDSLGGVLAPLNPATIRLDAAPGLPPPWLDCDTPDDLAIARRAWTMLAEYRGG